MVQFLKLVICCLHIIVTESDYHLWSFRTSLQIFLLIPDHVMMLIVLITRAVNASSMQFFSINGLIVKSTSRLHLFNWSYEETHSQWCFHLYRKMLLLDLAWNFLRLDLIRFATDSVCHLFCRLNSGICYILLFRGTRNLPEKHLRSVQNPLLPLSWEYLLRRTTSEYPPFASHHCRNYHMQLQNSSGIFGLNLDTGSVAALFYLLLHILLQRIMFHYHI